MRGALQSAGTFLEHLAKYLYVLYTPEKNIAKAAIKFCSYCIALIWDDIS